MKRLFLMLVLPCAVAGAQVAQPTPATTATRDVREAANSNLEVRPKSKRGAEALAAKARVRAAMLADSAAAIARVRRSIAPPPPATTPRRKPAPPGQER